jgi:hypothetical protein
MSNDYVMFLVLDLHELRMLVGISKRDPVLFLSYLNHRFEGNQKPWQRANAN